VVAVTFYERVEVEDRTDVRAERELKADVPRRPGGDRQTAERERTPKSQIGCRTGGGYRDPPRWSRRTL
jgi:hypothetical protein